MSLRWFIIGLIILIAAGFGIYLGTAGDSPDNPGNHIAEKMLPVQESGIAIPETDNLDGAAANDDPVADDTPKTPDNKPVSLRLNNPKIIIWKSERRLELYSDGAIVRSYRIGLGHSPEGDKEREGDGRTPEGEFYVCEKNPHSRFYLSLGISYPSIDDADRGLRDGLINNEEHERIVYAINHRQRPPWNTGLGGEVCIHGHGSSSDWTLGCIALDNDHIEELYNLVPKGTPVVINP